MHQVAGALLSSNPVIVDVPAIAGLYACLRCLHAMVAQSSIEIVEDILKTVL